MGPPKKENCLKSGPSQKVLKMARLTGKLDLFGALCGVHPIEGPPLRDLKGQFVECIVRPPLFLALKTKIAECIVRPPLFSTLEIKK